MAERNSNEHGARSPAIASSLDAPVSAAPSLDTELPTPVKNGAPLLGSDNIDGLEELSSTETDDVNPQHLSVAGVEADEAEDSMATLTFHPGMMQDEPLAPVQHHAAVDSRMAERLVEGGDADLMLRLKAGDLACFDVLMNKYRRQMVHFMFRMVHNQAVAEEMAQEVFLRVYRARETYRAEAKFTTWLYRIATNLAVNLARDTKNERLAPKVLLDEPEYESGSMPDVADSTPSIEQEMLRRERMNAIKQHVLALPERQRMAVLMHKYQDMDYKSIGSVLKLSESATKSLLFRAYQTLREKLKDFV